MNRHMKPTRPLAWLLLGLLSATFAVNLGAQTTPDATARPRPSVGYDKAREITVTGTVQEVVAKSSPGSPVGLHILIAGSGGIVDAHIGPYLAKDAQDALHTGLPVQIVGAMETLHGKNLLLARQLIFGGRMITVRNENGFLVRAHAPRVARSTPAAQFEKTTQVELNGGAR